MEKPTKPVTPQAEPAVSRRRLLQGGLAVAAGAAATPLLAACGSSSSTGGASGTSAAAPGTSAAASGTSAAASGTSAAASGTSATSGTSAPKGTTGKGKKITLNLMSWEQFEPGETVAWHKVVSDFTVANPNIEVKWSGWPFANYDQNVIAQAQAGHIDADVVMCPPELASTLIMDYNLCEPLGQIAESLGLKPNPAHDQFVVDGKLYLVGVLEVAFLLAYDYRMLKAGGYDAPPTTPDEWLEMTKKLTHAPKQYGTLLVNTAAAAADMWNGLQNWPLGFGGVWADGKTLTIDSPANVKAMEFWVELVKASGLAGTAEAALDKLWDNDQIASQFTVGFGSAALKQLAPKLYPGLRSAPPPWPGKKAIARLHGNVVLKTSKNLDAAYELTKWMITPKNLYYVTQQNGYPLIPYSNFAEKVPAYTAFEKSLPWLAGFGETNYVGEADILGDYVFAYAQLGNLIATNIEKAVSGSSTVLEALQSAQSLASQSLHLPT
jgi:multiple sugar transport system substrate-binding protein